MIGKKYLLETAESTPARVIELLRWAGYGPSQQALADVLGTAQASVSRWSTGRNQTMPRGVRILAAALLQLRKR